MIEMSLPAGLERRREDYKLITGLGHYVDDLKLPLGRPRALHMAVVRSPYAHAEIQSIELDAARALPEESATVRICQEWQHPGTKWRCPQRSGPLHRFCPDCGNNLSPARHEDRSAHERLEFTRL